jgi:hypothetical protein
MLIEVFNRPSTALGAYIAEQVNIIRGIPDGVRLAYYPTHDESPLCWCRPHFLWSIYGPVLLHKNLHNREFDS